MGIVTALLNFVVAPIGIALPVLVKQVREMPPWFLGALESSVSIGGILGALSVGWVCKKIFPDIVSVAGIIIIGIGVALMPWIPNPALPIVMMFVIGVGAMFTNITLSTRMAMAMPDRYRARAGSFTQFLSEIASPFGTAFAGVMISGVGLSWTMLLSGALLVICGPLLFFVPKFSEFFRLADEKVEGYYVEKYPSAFEG